MIRRTTVSALIAVVVAVALTGCGTSLTHLRDICRDVTSGTASLAAYDPAHPLTALQYALGRFTLVERAVSLAGESGLPGADGRSLQRDWLDRSTASMADWDVRLEALRTAVNDRNEGETASRLQAAVAVGTEGVNTGELRTAGLGVCADAFTAPSVPKVSTVSTASGTPTATGATSSGS